MNKQVGKGQRETGEAAQHDDGQAQPPEPFADIEVEIERRLASLVQGKTKDKVVSQVLAVVTQEAYKGPIPHPRHLQAYENTCPGASDRILKMAEASLQCQIDLAKSDQKDEALDRKLGMWLGFTTLVVLVLAALVCVYLGHVVFAGGFLGVGALGTVGRFVMGRNNGVKK